MKRIGYLLLFLSLIPSLEAITSFDRWLAGLQEPFKSHIESEEGSIQIDPYRLVSINMGDQAEFLSNIHKELNDARQKQQPLPAATYDKIYAFLNFVNKILADEIKKGTMINTTLISEVRETNNAFRIYHQKFLNDRPVPDFYNFNKVSRLNYNKDNILRNTRAGAQKLITVSTITSTILAAITGITLAVIYRKPLKERFIKIGKKIH